MTDVLFETGCCLCGKPSYGTVSVEMVTVRFCEYHGTKISFNEFRAEVRRRKNIAPAIPEAKWKVDDWAEYDDSGKNRRVGQIVQLGHGQQIFRDTLGQSFWVSDEHLRHWTPRVGEVCVGLGVGSGIERGGTFEKFGRAEAEQVDCAYLLCTDGFVGWCVTRASLRPASAPPAEPRNGENRIERPEDVKAAPVPVAANSCMVCFAPIASGKQACLYCQHETAHPPQNIARITADRDAEYRKKRAALTLDLDRPSVRRDRRTGKIVEWIPRVPDPWEAE